MSRALTELTERSDRTVSAVSENATPDIPLNHLLDTYLPSCAMPQRRHAPTCGFASTLDEPDVTSIRIQ